MIENLKQSSINLPANSYVYRVLVAPNATVSAGDPILEWIDCGELFVDVPVSDAELPLLRTGNKAYIIIEGEKQKRTATVFLTRGASATQERDSLAAVAKGRRTGIAQVLLKLEPMDDVDECPVGRAAYVDFPNIGLIDIVRTRLRL